MPTTPTQNAEAAAANTRDGFGFVLTTDTSPYAEDNDDGHIFKFYA